MKKIYYRAYQGLTKLIMPLMPWRKPAVINGDDAIDRLPFLIKDQGVAKVLIVTEENIERLGLLKSLIEGLKINDVSFSIYNGTIPNPTIGNVEEALSLYKSENCDGIIAFGGGSSMDCAKGVGARLINPEKKISQLKGISKSKIDMPPFFAIPTTSGSGSEATIAAVITDEKNHEKFAIADWALVPHYAVLDPNVTISLPSHITAATGMDALTHAVEAFIGKGNTAETEKMAIEATQLIFKYLTEAYKDGSNIEARNNMQLASYKAGVAFTRAFVGYVHAIAHTLGGKYNVPHGFANAILLPKVLEEYGSSAYKRLAILADAVGIGFRNDSDKTKALRFIAAIKKMNNDMNIPDTLECIELKDIPEMALLADQEANPAYPVPKIFNRKKLEGIYKLIMV